MVVHWLTYGDDGKCNMGVYKRGLGLGNVARKT